MSDKHTDEGKGRLKEAAGAITGDDDLKNEGKADQAKASAKDAIDSASDGVQKAADKAKDALS